MEAETTQETKESPKSEQLWKDAIKMGELEIKNRICMAALTRQRCNPENGIPNELLLEYYSQRAGAGMILTEATAWSQRGEAFPGAACLFTKEHMEGWKLIIEEVHKKGGKIFIQIFHGGRACVESSTRGLEIWAPSAIAIRDKHRRTNSDSPTPKEMTIEDIEFTKNEFRNSMELAKEAGFDGVQLHGAHGYLIDEFLRTGSNHRTDKYGGSAENRCRFALELTDIALEYFPSYAVGMKITPVSRLNDQFDENPLETYSYLLKELNTRNVGFVEIRESNEVYGGQQSFPHSSQEQMPNVCGALRKHYNGILIGNEQFNNQSGLEKIRSGDCDMISFGRLYVSNPDLAERILNGNELNTNWDIKTFFGSEHGAKGYIDYPRFNVQEKEQKNNEM